jgi:UDP-N-acetylglucosamine--N-acetylmuramyl-(pentapeptide) pyrophosphoryl-undecaprenol N-acetylglucosamine transferase
MIVFTCGGTGGHISPALNIADKLKEDICFIGGDRLEKVMIKNYEFICLPSLKRNILSIIISIFEARTILKKLKPKFVFATGGYVTIPVGIASITLGLPIILLEQNSIPGKTNRFLSKFAKLIFTGYPIASFSQTKTIFSGNPVAEILHDKKTKLLVFGGSQGSKTINELIKNNLTELSKLGLEIVWITGEKTYDRITNELAKYETKENTYVLNKTNIEIYPFRNDIPELLAKTKIAISRSGAMSISELTENCIPTLYIPYPYATDDHQTFNAKYIVDNQAGEMILEKDLNDDIFLKTIIQLNNSTNTYQTALKKLPNNATGIIIDKLKQKGFI